MMERLDGDAALDAAARVNTRENVRLTFDHKVEQVIQEIVDSNFDLHKRITTEEGDFFVRSGPGTVKLSAGGRRGVRPHQVWRGRQRRWTRQAVRNGRPHRIDPVGGLSV